MTNPPDDAAPSPGALRASLAARRARALRSGQMHAVPAAPPAPTPSGAPGTWAPVRPNAPSASPIAPKAAAPRPAAPWPNAASHGRAVEVPPPAPGPMPSEALPRFDARESEALARQRIAQSQRLQAHRARAAVQAASELHAGPLSGAAADAHPVRGVAAGVPYSATDRTGTTASHPEAASPAGQNRTERDEVAARIAARAAALRAEVAQLRSAPVPAASPSGMGARLGALRRSVGLGSGSAALATGRGADEALDDVDATHLSPRAAWQAGASARHRAIAAVLPGTAQHTPAGHTWRLQANRHGHHHHGDHPLDLAEAWARDWLPLLAEDSAFARLNPRRGLYFDLETTGLDPAHTLPFLIGAGSGHPGGYTLEQWLLRSPEEEPAALLALAERVAEADWLVSFNGRAFDAPVLSARYRAHGLPDPFAPEVCPPHLDLLPLSRRLLAEHLPNAKLSTLEMHHLGLRRVDDVPGSAVPARYTAWLAEGEAEALVDVVRHNADDIWSLITLLGVLLTRVAEAPSLVLRAPKAALRVAKAAERLQPDHAEAIYRAAEAFPDTATRGTAGLARMARAEARQRRAREASAGALPTAR